MLAAGLAPADARRLALAIGLPLGLAFQLADDLLDVIGSSRNTGKPVGGDIREGKRTVLLADAIEAAGDVERRELIDMWEAESRDEAHVRRAIALFESTGAIARSKERIAGLWRRPPSRRLNYRRIAKTRLPKHAHVSYRLCGNRADATAL